MSQYYRICYCLFVYLLCWNCNAYAHKPSDSYLVAAVEGTQIKGQWDIALRDLDFAIGLDENANNEITWQEVLNKQQEINAYAFARLHIENAQVSCLIMPQKKILIDHHTDGAYAVIQYSASCTEPVTNIQLSYTLFADIDPSHRGLLKLDYKGTSKTSIFGPENAIQNFLLEKPNRLTEFKNYLVEGIGHIWAGYDHILFLLSLLLPAVLIRKSGSWQPSPDFKSTFIDVLKVVTAFTIAHSITLTLATLHIISLPSRWVEAAIAASVIVAALNNIFPVILKKRWLAAFVFGLIHGFGFASVLSDLGLQNGSLFIALVGFNVGVEIGQIGILSIYLPISFALRKTWFYQHVFFYGGSIFIIAIATIWFVERAFNIGLFTFIK